MTPLRKKMIEAMRVRGFAVRTHQSYLSAVSKLAGYYGRSPDALGVDELQAYFAYLATERLSGTGSGGAWGSLRPVTGKCRVEA